MSQGRQLVLAHHLAENQPMLVAVRQFAAEVALAAVEPIPSDNTRYVGDVSDFLNA